MDYHQHQAPLCQQSQQNWIQHTSDVLNRLPENPAIRFAGNGDKTELILSPLDAVEETPSLITLRQRVADMLPHVDLPEVLLEIDAPTHFTDARSL